MIVLIFRLGFFYLVGFVLVFFVVFVFVVFLKLSLKKANVKEFVEKEARVLLSAIRSSLSSSNVKIQYRQVLGFSGGFLSHSFL